MCTGFIEIALILLPIGFIGRPYHNMPEDVLARSQRVTGILLLLGLYIITNLLLLGGDEVRATRPRPAPLHPQAPSGPLPPSGGSPHAVKMHSKRAAQ